MSPPAEAVPIGTSGKVKVGQPSETASIPYHTKKSAPLDDPFIIDTGSFKAFTSGCSQPGNQITVANGSLDLEYEFPVKFTAPSPPSVKIIDNTLSRGLSMQGEREVLTSIRHTTKPLGRVSQSSIRDVGFGEEVIIGRALDGRSPILLACNEQTSRPDTSGLALIAGPRSGASQTTARSLFPGMTIANPHRGLLRSELTAMTCKNHSSQAASARIGKPETTTAMLQFSDPDGIRQGQEYEIANGLSQQAPTAQNFKGPFFTASKPTAHDPTLSLSILISEEEKLLTWFRDGHRPARQREHAVTLVSAGIVSGKCQGFGTTGESMLPTHKRCFENTTPFVRLYESFSEYVEEYRNGGGGSYFNRAWKAAHPQMRDFDADGNKSYFTDAGAAIDSVSRRVGPAETVVLP